MRFTYDPYHNIAYIRFREKQSGVEAIQVSDELVVDRAPDGTIYGIELLNANEQRRDVKSPAGGRSPTMSTTHSPITNLPTTNLPTHHTEEKSGRNP